MLLFVVVVLAFQCEQVGREETIANVDDWCLGESLQASHPNYSKLAIIKDRKKLDETMEANCFTYTDMLWTSIKGTAKRFVVTW